MDRINNIYGAEWLVFKELDAFDRLATKDVVFNMQQARRAIVNNDID